MRYACRAHAETPHKHLPRLPAEDFDDFSAEDDSSALTTQQVQTLLNVVCDETEIAEIELKV